MDKNEVLSSVGRNSKKADAHVSAKRCGLEHGFRGEQQGGSAVEGQLSPLPALTRPLPNEDGGCKKAAGRDGSFSQRHH